MILSRSGKLKNSGYKEITLLGQNVQFLWKKDLNNDTSFCNIFRRSSKTGIDKFVLQQVILGISLSGLNYGKIMIISCLLFIYLFNQGMMKF